MDHEDHKFRISECFNPVFRRKDGRGDIEGRGNFLSNHVRGRQPIRVDVVQGDGAIRKHLVQQNIPDNIFHEDGTTGSDQTDFGHLLLQIDRKEFRATCGQGQFDRS